MRFFFVGSNSPLINTNRIAQRVMEGGHDVPINKIISRYVKSIHNCCFIANLVDRLYVYDNSEELAVAKLLLRSKNGIIEKQYATINEWAKPILSCLKNQ